MEEGVQTRHLRVVLEPKEADELPPTDSALEAVSQPVYGVRAQQPGPRGCWALKRDGNHCGAAKRKDSDFCTAHSGLGVAQDPARWAPIAQQRSAENRQRRAALRLELGISRPSSIRGMLRGAVWAERERVVAAALSPITATEGASPALRSKTALALLDAVEPQPRATLDVPLPTTPDGVDGLSLAELRALVERVS